MKRIVIMAGGTGGHVMPALTVAELLQQQGHSVHWMGTRHGLESRLVPQAGLPISYISIHGLRGKSRWSQLLAPFRLAIAITQALAIMWRLKPDAVLGMGGFASGPGGFAAWLLRKRLIIHEQNSIPGVTNTLLAKFANQILQAFPTAFANAITVGNPVRPSILAIADPQARLSLHKDAIRLLVLGGSQGALRINELVPAAVATLAASTSIEVWHQTGKSTCEQTNAAYQQHNLNARVEAFIDDMATAYVWADLVICRSGALTIAELAAAGLGSILIPYPFAVDDHQTNNAEYLVNADAAIVIQQAELSVEKLSQILGELINNPQKRLTMARQARKLCHRDAAQLIAAACLGSGSQVNMDNVRHIHLIGIGGVGMGGIAEVLLTKGYQVSGSDNNNNPMTQHLQQLGVEIFQGHAARYIKGADVVVFSSAISTDNPEVVAAKLNKIPLVQRAQMLAEVMRDKDGIAITGTHGKTTTTGLMADVLITAGLDPTFVVGGKLNSVGTNARYGSGNIIVVEADESDASFLCLPTKIAVVTNIDADHMPTYANDFEQLKQAFRDFLTHLPNDGLAVLCIEDDHVAQMKDVPNCPVITYGFSSDADIYATDIQQNGTQVKFVVHDKHGHSTAVLLNMPGIHNVLNALSVFAVAKHLGVDDQSIQTAMKEFVGVGRRFQMTPHVKIPQGEVITIDDYGHHPKEVAATVEAVRKAWPDRRFVLVYQPHRYTRTQALFNEFVQVLQQPDLLVLLDVYSAGEPIIQGAQGKDLYQAIVKQAKHKPVFIERFDHIESQLATILKNDDIVLLQGAGTIGRFAAQVANTKLINQQQGE